MSRGARVSALTRMEDITALPLPVELHPTKAEAPPEPAEPPVAVREPLVRYTAEIPKRLHRRLKTFAMDNDTSTYAVTRALLTLLDTDDDVTRRVRRVLAETHQDARSR